MKKPILILSMTLCLIAFLSLSVSAEPISYYPENDALIALWDFNGNASDSAGRGMETYQKQNEPTLDNMPDITIFNGSMEFTKFNNTNPEYVWSSAWQDGAMGRVLDITKNFTIYLELNVHEWGNSGHLIKAQNEIEIRMSGNNMIFDLKGDCNGISFSVISEGIPTGTSHFVYDYSTEFNRTRVYVNNVLVEQDVTCNPTLGESASAPAFFDFSSGTHLNASVKTIVFWNKSLTNQSLLELSNGTYKENISQIVNPSHEFIGCLGDSILKQPDPPGKLYCEFLNNLTDWRTWRYAVAGDTSTDLLLRSGVLSTLNKGLQRTIIMIGTNDMDVTNDGNTTIEVYYNALLNLTQSILDDGQNVTIMTIPPCNNANRNCSGANQTVVTNRNNVIRRVAYDKNIDYCDIYNDSFGGGYTDSDFTDGLHPTEAAHFKINATLNTCLLSPASFNCTLDESGCFNFTALSADTTPPTYTLFQNSGTRGTSTFSILLADNIQLNTYRFAHNQTGTLTNGSDVSISGTSFPVTEELTITLTAGSNICGQFWFNDTSNNENQTGLSCFTVSAGPVITGSTSNILRTGVAVLLALAILSVFMLPLLTKTDLSIGLIITMLLVFILAFVAINFIFTIT